MASRLSGLRQWRPRHRPPDQIGRCLRSGGRGNDDAWSSVCTSTSGENDDAPARFPCSGRYFRPGPGYGKQRLGLGGDRQDSRPARMPRGLNSASTNRSSSICRSTPTTFWSPTRALRTRSRARRGASICSARASAQTNIFVFGANGEQIVSLDLAIERDVAGLEDYLRRFIPNSDINVELLNDNVVLTGTVETPLDAKRAADLADHLRHRRRSDHRPIFTDRRRRHASTAASPSTTPTKRAGTARSSTC